MYKFRFPLASILLIATACDSEAVDSDAQRSAEQADPELAERASMAVGVVCLKLDCTEQQRRELTAIAKGAMPDEQERASREGAMQTFADAFRADELDTEMLAALHDRRIADREHIRDSFLAAHQVLDGEQRGELADMVESGFGPPRLMMVRDADPVKVAERIAARLCGVVACDEAQQTDIAAAIAEGAIEPSKSELSAMRGRVAEILRTDDLDAATLDRFAAEMEAKRGRLRPRVLDTLAEVHAMLSSEQRNALAAKLERDGPGGFAGPGMLRR